MFQEDIALHFSESQELLNTIPEKMLRSAPPQPLAEWLIRILSRVHATEGLLTPASVQALSSPNSQQGN